MPSIGTFCAGAACSSTRDTSFIFVIQGFQAFPVLSCASRDTGRWEQWSDPIRCCTKSLCSHRTIPGDARVMLGLRQMLFGEQTQDFTLHTSELQSSCDHNSASHRAQRSPSEGIHRRVNSVCPFACMHSVARLLAPLRANAVPSPSRQAWLVPSWAGFHQPQLLSCDVWMGGSMLINEPKET